jgi:hypothetical protein
VQANKPLATDDGATANQYNDAIEIQSVVHTVQHEAHGFCWCLDGCPACVLRAAPSVLHAYAVGRLQQRCLPLVRWCMAVALSAGC